MRFSNQKNLVYLALAAIAVLFMFPFYWILSSSLKSRKCMAMVPPAYFPCEAETTGLRIAANKRIVEFDEQQWFRLCSSQDLIGENNTSGGYYIKLDGYKPTSLVRWMADSNVSVVISPVNDMEFPRAQVHRIKGDSEEVIVVAKMVRQSKKQFNEIIFIASNQGNVNKVEPLLNAKHKQIRQFSCRWENYPETLEGPDATLTENKIGFATFLRNSFFISTMAVIGQIISSSIVAYGFSRLRFKGRDFLFVIVLATMMIPGQVTLIPLFAIYKHLGWINTFLPLIVPHFTAGAFNVFLMRQYMLTLPKELDESAAIDGCGPIRRYFFIILPNCVPVLIVVSLFTFVYTWQDVMGPLIYLDNPAYRTVTLGLEYFRSPYVDNAHLLMTGAVMAMLPVAILFIFLQKYIMSGIATTGLKG